MKTRLQVSKLDGARRQLETAIKLYFANADFVSIHTLAFAAFNITKNLCDRQPDHPSSFSTWMKQNIPEKYQKECWQRMNEAGNFLKHADRDAEALLDYVPDQYEFFLMMGIQQYRSLTQEEIPVFHAFRIWFLWHNPEWLDKAKDRKTIEDIRDRFPDERGAFFTEVVPLLMKLDMARIEQNASADARTSRD